MDVRVGDVVVLKKSHPCGSSRFSVLRVGLDYRLKCCGCGHEIMTPRLKIQKCIRKVERSLADD